MKFGEKLKENIIPEWKAQYIDYNVLKLLIKEGTTQDESTSKKLEKEFMKQFRHELRKVSQFTSSKFNEIKNNIVHLVKSVNIPHEAIEEENILKWKQSADSISNEIILLENYLRWNKLGFKKIIKKYDKRFERNVAAWVYTKLEEEELYSTNLNYLLVPLSEIYEYIRRIQMEDFTPKEPEYKPSRFERNTKKFFIKNDYLMKLKMEFLKKLPIYIFGRKNLFQNLESLDLVKISDYVTKTSDSSTITSVYLDDDLFSQYHKRLQQEEGASVLRFRWYGEHRSPNHEVLAERKVHHEKWVMISKVPLKWKFVQSYMKNEWTIDDQVNEDVQDGVMTEEQAEELCRLSSEIQKEISNNFLKPMVRTAYKRTAFQRYDDDSIRISIDTNLSFNNEDVAKSDWCLSDEQIKKEGRSVVFPYSILEVKLEEKTPDWIKKIIDTFLKKEAIIPVSKFSKFLTATAIFHKQTLEMIPNWFDEHMLNLVKEPPIPKMEESPEFILPKTRQTTSEEPSIDIEPTESQPLLHKRRLSKVFPFWSSDEARESGSESTDTKNGFFINLASRCFPKMARTKKDPDRYFPTKIEPKTFFANERTFMSWLSTSILLMTLAMALIGTGHVVTGMVVAPFCLFFILYAAWQFIWRTKQIKAKKPLQIHDWIGPLLLVVVLFVAVIANIAVMFVYEIDYSSLRTYNSFSDGQKCIQLAEQIPFSRPHGIAIKNETLFIASTYEIIQMDKSGKIMDRIKVPNWDLSGIASLPNKEYLYLTATKPQNSILKFHLDVRQVAMVYPIDSGTKPLEGLSYDPFGNILFHTSSFGIVGYDPQEKASVRLITPEVYAYQHKISGKGNVTDIAIKENYMFILLDDALKLSIVNMESGKVEVEHTLPGTFGWTGLDVERIGNDWNVYLTKAKGSQIWKFVLDINNGFSKCAWK